MNQPNRRLRNSLNAATRQTRKLGEAAGKTAQDTAQGVGNALTGSAANIADLTKASINLSQDAGEGLLKGTATLAGQLQKLPGDAFDRLFPECPLPLFIIPTGPNPEEYGLLFDLAEMFDHLKSGRFVRPRIDAWAARSDGWDVERLSAELSQEFSRQFNQRREGVIASGEVNLQELENRITTQSTEMSNQLAKSTSSLLQAPFWTGAAVVTGAVGVWIPFAWPVALPIAAIYLGLAVYRGHKAFSILETYFKLLSDRKDSRRALRSRENQLQELAADLDSKNRDFQRAVGNIEIKVHPQVSELFAMMCDVAGVVCPPAAGSDAAGRAPDLRPYLNAASRPVWFPRHYEPLLNAL